MKPTLELPKTIRAPKMNEVPMNSSIKERLQLRETGNIVEGYKILPKGDNPEHSNLAFNFYAEININNSRLWNLILELSKELPNEVSFIFNYADSDPNYGLYTNKANTIKFLSQYKTEIISDPFIDIGLIFHSESKLIEIFITESKYIKFWGVDQESFLKTMDNFKLEEVDGIEFVDEYPKVRESLRLFDTETTDTKKLMEIFKREFK